MKWSEHSLLIAKNRLTDSYAKMFVENGFILSGRVFDTFWEYQRQIDDTSWNRLHQIGTNLYEEDLVPGSGVASMMVNIVTDPLLAGHFTGCTGNLVGGA